MNGEEVMKAYCSACVHKKKCWRPCITVLKEMIWQSQDNQSIIYRPLA